MGQEKTHMHNTIFRTEVLRIILPPLLATILFVVALFAVALPTFQNNLMEQKKKMITAVTQTAWNILAYYDQQMKAGELSRRQAQASAIQHIRQLRYGPEEKDYFWINDLQPKMVMHPYRPDLEDQDISRFTDPGGKHPFLEFIEVAHKDGSGYVPYLWQWQDDPKRIVPKLSYVKLFEPWGWVIGTGIYVDDVQIESRAILKTLTNISIGILVVVVLLSLYIIRRGMEDMKRRQVAERELQKHHDHLEELVEKRTFELRDALSKVRVLSGFLPICASCKNIRDDRGYWNQIEKYIREHTYAEFTHSICPDCAKKLYPGLVDKDN
jgi:signal transduction histidine kinase